MRLGHADQSGYTAIFNLFGRNAQDHYNTLRHLAERRTLFIWDGYPSMYLASLTPRFHPCAVLQHTGMTYAELQQARAVLTSVSALVEFTIANYSV